MKKLLLFMSICICFLFACGAREPVIMDGEHAVITVSAERVNDGTTLKQYMDLLVSDGDLSYEMQSGMVTSVNGVAAGNGKYWLLYTDDETFAVPSWGACEYQGKVYGSSSLGAETLVVKAGCTYIWYLTEVQT